MSAYVPPWKRKAQESVASGSTAGPNSREAERPQREEEHVHSLADLLEHLGGRKMGTINMFSYGPPVVAKKSVKEMLQEERDREKAAQADPSSSVPEDKTTPAPIVFEPHPRGHLISWIHMVPNAHPLFMTEDELWFHTNSQAVTDHPENLGRPIPFFGQPVADRGSSSFRSPTSAAVPFYGYWTLKSYHAVPPHSDELRELLATKQGKSNYGKQGRTAEMWGRAMTDSWVKVKVERFQPVAGEEDKWKDPLRREFGSPGQDKAEAWLDFVLQDIASRQSSPAEAATESDGLNSATAEMAIGGPAPNLPEPTVPVLPSKFKDDHEETPEAREQRMVHDVYETIAPHFSQTRYKPWPIIARFLSSIPPHSIGLDSGAGNGKYLPVVREGSRGSRMIALDRSSGLLSVARTQKGEIGEEVVGGAEECVRGDLCYDGWRRGVFDFAISIAAVHHLSTRSRRVQSIRSLLAPLYLSSVAPYSKFIVYVWAYEQGENSKRKMGVLASPPEDDDGDTERKKDQDVLVPWVLQGPQEKKVKVPRPRRTKSKPGQGRPGGLDGRTDEGIDMAKTTNDDETTSRSDDTHTNDAAIEARAQPAEPTTAPAEQAQPERQVYHRYYHLFVEGELREDVIAAAKGMGFALRPKAGEEAGEQKGEKWLRIIEEGYEKDNWYLEGEVGVC